LAWALDETGTINTLQFLSVEEKCERDVLIEQQEKNRVCELGLPDEVLRVHGVAPATSETQFLSILTIPSQQFICARPVLWHSHLFP
jgi:hypothetical protein